MTNSNVRSRNHILAAISLGMALFLAWTMHQFALAGTSENVTFSPTPTPPTDVGDYAVLGLNSVWFLEKSDLHSGHVGVMDASPGPVLNADVEVSIGNNAVFHDPESVIVGDSIKLKKGADVFDIFYNDLDLGPNTTHGQLITPLTLPLAIDLPPFPEITPGTTDYVVPRNGRLELAAGAYGDVTLKQNSVLTLTGGIYHFANFDLGRDSEVWITAPTEIRIDDRLKPGERATIGPAAGSGLDATDFVIYVGGINGSSGNLGATPKAASIGKQRPRSTYPTAPSGSRWGRRPGALSSPGM